MKNRAHCARAAIFRIIAPTLALALSIVANGPADAQSCSANASSEAFGYASAGSLFGQTTTGQISEGCSKGWTTNGTLAMCNSIGTGTNSVSQTNRRMTFGANFISYQLYSDPAFTIPFAYPGNATVSIPYTASNNNYATTNIYAKILSPSTGLPAGTYTDTYSAASQIYITFDATAPNTPIACGPTGNTYVSASPAFQVTVNYLASCRVSAAPMSFGNAYTLTANIDAQTNLSVTCTSGAPYTVALGPGQGLGATTAARLMSGPGGNIGYALYRNAGRTANWGNQTGVDTVAGTGTGAAQSIPVYGRVPPQTLVSTGNYSDTVIVTLTY
jgi:spore coat protein U-like protein